MTTVNKTHGKNWAHKQTVEQITGKCNPSNADGFLSSTWACGTPKSTGNAFSEVRKSPFAGDQAERAKATLHSRKVAIQEPKGGHAVHGLKNLSKRGQRLLAPVRANFCTPIEPAGSGIARLAKTKTRI